MTILWSSVGEVPTDQNDVRNTATPVNQDAPAAELESVPERGAMPETYRDPRLGMSPRQMSGYYTPQERYRPALGDLYDENHRYNDIINQQVATSGTAAERERNGEWGHGTMPITRSLEPVADLTEGGKLGNDYFTRGMRDANATSHRGVEAPPNYDSDTARATADAADSASKAAHGANYAGWFSGMGYV